MNPHAPAQERARKYLRELISRRLSAAGPRKLPPVGELAGAAGVSLVTMVKAVRSFRDQGLLQTSHGRGTTIVCDTAPPDAPPEAPREATPAPRRKWEKLCSRIEREILNGFLGAEGVLPPTKEMLRRYGVCDHTLRKALHALVERGRLEWGRRRYRVRRAGRGYGGSSVVLIARGDSQHHFRVVSPRTVEHTYALERECIQAGVRLDILTYDVSTGLLYPSPEEHLRPEAISVQGNVLGCMVWQVGFEPDEMRRLLNRLSGTRVPVAVLDESGSEADQPTMRLPRGCALFRIVDDVCAGATVARFLLDLGHRDLAFVSPIHERSYSIGRLEGIRQVWEQAGLIERLSVVAAPEPSLRGRIGSIAPMRDNMSGALSAVLPRGGALHRRAQHEVQTVARHQTIAAITRALLHEEGFPGYASAWVAPTDTVAVACLDHIESAGRRVPADISLAGFDNSQMSLVHMLTSYNFNGAAAIRAMLEYILRGSVERRRMEGARFAFDGYLVERMTTARAHRSVSSG